MHVVPAGYTLDKPIHISSRSEVLAAIREADGQSVVLKSYATDRTGHGHCRADREFAMLRRVEGPGVPHVFDVDRSTERPFLVLERIAGASLVHRIADGPLRIEGWLDIAVRTCEILARVHAGRVVHKDVTPENILVERTSGNVWLCDFGISAELGAPKRKTGLLAGTLAASLRYISPEQSGRMNRGCDFRSDLYSLGATLFHALTGRPPFDTEDRLELIHSHLARIPPTARELVPDVPEAISHLLSRLLRKEPEERYQSARGLHGDLLACRDRLASSLTITSGFELGTDEVPEQPRFTSRLHGRERESARMNELYERALTGRTQALWIEGPAGVGKSALVMSLHPRLAKSGGYLAVGKFDLYRERAYSGWVAALGSLVQQILVESDARLERWRDEIRAGLGNIAGALVSLVPDLAFIVGETTPVPPLGPRETRARLSLALQRFLASCSTPEHPLVLFLDDLQWSDAGSRALLEELLSSDSSAALLVIGAWRSGADAAHPQQELVERLKQRGLGFDRIELAPLTLDASIALLSESLERTPNDVRSFAELIERKTGNCALLVQQFVEHIHARGLLRYELGLGWSWSPAEVAAADIPEGAVAFMTAKLDRLPAEARTLLQFASCVGDEFDAELLCELSGHPQSSLELDLFTLSDAGLIAPCPLGFRFVHDRLREAAQQLLSEAEREQIHYDIARLLLQRIPESEREPRVLEVVEHLNRGRTHLPEELRLTAIRLNHRAGSRSLMAGAAVAASGYLAVARELFREEDWETQRALGLDLVLQSAECALQNGEFAAAGELLDSLERRVPSRFEFAQIAVKRLQVRALRENPEKCAHFFLEVMRDLGVRWPAHPSGMRTRLALRAIGWMLRGRTGIDILRPATSVDLEWLAPILVVGQGGGALIRYDVQLTALATCFVLRRYIRRGYIARAPFTIASYANWLQIILGDVKGARRFAESALALNERVPDPVYGPRCEMQIYGMLYPWFMPRRQALARLDQVAEALREIGDPEYAYYTRFLKVSYCALAGDPVQQSMRELAELAESVERSGHSYPEPNQCQRAYAFLARPSSDDEMTSELAASDAWHEANPGWAQPYARTIWLLVLCVHGRHDLAFAQCQKLELEMLRITPFVHVADHTFYRGLAASALASTASGRLRRRYTRDLARSLRRLRRWSAGGPDFAHMATSLAAERAWLARKVHAAPMLYEQAANLAKKQGYPHHAALAHERRARLLGELNRDTEAMAAFKEAIRMYRAWGAKPKADELERERRLMRT